MEIKPLSTFFRLLPRVEK